MIDLAPYFDTAFAAPDGIKKLRELILSLAMQGKLVPQDPNDPPARELLKEIEAEKQRLVKEGKIKAPKSLPPITPEEVPYALPEGWEWVRFIDLLDFNGGSQPPKTQFIDEARDGYVQLIQIRDLGPNPQPVYVPKDSVSKFCTTTDIMIGRYGASVGKVFWGKDGAYNVALIKLNNDLGGYERHFLYNLMISPLGQSLFLGITRSAQDGFSKDDIAYKCIPLPPLPEQHRIVAKIDQLMARCDELEQLRKQHEQQQLTVHRAALQGLLTTSEPEAFAAAWQFMLAHFESLHQVKPTVTELRKAILQWAVMGKLVPQDPNDPPASELLKEIEAEKQRLVKEKKIKAQKPLPAIKAEEVPYKLPEGWEWVRVVEVSQLIEYGTSQKTGDDASQVPVYRMGNINDGVLINKNFKYIDASIEDLPKLFLKKNDILFNRTNSYELVGKSALYLGEDDKATFASYLIRIRLFLKSINSLYINLAMNATYFRETQIEPHIVQQCGQANFNGTKLSLCLIPLPPLPEQHRIVAKIDQLMALRDRLEESIEAKTDKSSALLNAVMAAV